MAVPIHFETISGQSRYGVFFLWRLGYILGRFPDKVSMRFYIYGYFDTCRANSRRICSGGFYSFPFLYIWGRVPGKIVMAFSIPGYFFACEVWGRANLLLTSLFAAVSIHFRIFPGELGMRFPSIRYFLTFQFEFRPNLFWSFLFMGISIYLGPIPGESVWGFLSMGMSMDSGADSGPTYYRVFYLCLFHYIFLLGACGVACYGGFGPELIVLFFDLILRQLVIKICYVIYNNLSLAFLV